MFRKEQKLKAIGITHIFESIPATPFGNAETVVVLDDKAGITYGISQCTHASGNLADCVSHYLEFGSSVLHYDYFQIILPK